MCCRVLMSLTSFALFAASVVADQPAAKSSDPAEIVIVAQFEKDGPKDQFIGQPCRIHALKMEKNKTYVIDMLGANMAPYFRVEDSIGNTLATGQNRGNNQARIRFTSPKEDTYLITASGHGAVEGKYTLTVKPFVAAAAKLFPFPAPEANKPASVNAVLTADDTPDQYREFPGKVYVVELKAGKTYVIDMISQQFDAFLLLQNENAGLIAQDDDSGGNLNSRIRYQAPATGRYRLVASTFNGNMGAFTLRVTQEP